ncbi:MAG: lytic murein transglycosylase [Pseudomonadota bacterium]
MKASATVALLIAASSLAPLALADYRDDPKTELLHQKLVREYAFTPQDLVQVDEALALAERQPQLVQAERQNKEVTTPLWDSYRAIHVFPKQISNGLRVLRENQQWFERAEAEYGVPPVISAAILGVETKYGSFTGRNRVLDALVTQGYEHPTRSKFFFNELAAYFAFCRDFRRAPTEVKGSYAGAVGFAQFMPSNYITLALDYDSNGSVDLWSMPDAIGSIAHYFTRYQPPDRPAVHWRRGEPLLVPVKAIALKDDAAARNTKSANGTIGSWIAAGVTPGVDIPLDTPAGLLELRRPDGPEYWLALPNFYAVMTYNPRVFYAMAVTQLAAELQAAQATAAPN